MAGKKMLTKRLTNAERSIVVIAGLDPAIHDAFHQGKTFGEI
jgi:hypothetical protein